MFLILTKKGIIPQRAKTDQSALFEKDNKKFNYEHVLSRTSVYAPRNDTKEIKIP